MDVRPGDISTNMNINVPACRERGMRRRQRGAHTGLGTLDAFGRAQLPPILDDGDPLPSSEGPVGLAGIMLPSYCYRKGEIPGRTRRMWGDLIPEQSWAIGRQRSTDGQQGGGQLISAFGNGFISVPSFSGI